MQGLADGYFIVPLTIGDYLGSNKLEPVSPDHPEVRATEAAVRDRTERLLAIKGSAHGRRRSTASSARRCGSTAAWRAAPKGSRRRSSESPALRAEFWRDVRVPGTGAELNQSLEHAGRVADFLELAELMCVDALQREESCGGHFRVEYQTPDGEARRRDDEFAYVAAWEFAGEGKPAVLNKEPLVFENVALSQRSYK